MVVNSYISNSDMKKFILWISTVIVTICALDYVLGVFFDRFIMTTALPGDYETVDYILRGDNNNDIVVLGSSVALNGIKTKIVEDSIGVTAYNAGANGQTFPYYLTLLKALIANHAPNKVILGVNPNVLADDGIGARYNFLVPYYGLGISDIDERLVSRRTFDKLFLKSNAYKLNTIWFRILLYHFVEAGIKGENGFIGKPVPPSYPQKDTEIIPMLSDERKQELIEFIRLCKDNDIDLIIIFTPQYHHWANSDNTSNVVYMTTKIASQYDVRVYNDLQIEPFASDSTLFYDDEHLNINGAAVYTNVIINRLKCN